MAVNTRPFLRACVSFGIFVAALGFPSWVAEGQTTAQCTDDYPEAQRLIRAARFLAARDKLLACSQDVCPATVRNECIQLLDDVEKRTPSVFIVGRDKAGRDTLDVRVMVDGQEVAQSLTASAIALDPGEHALRFEHDGAVVEQQLVLREGEKLRQLVVDFAPAGPSDPFPPPTVDTPPSATSAALPPAAPKRTKRPTPVSVYVFGGLGLVGLGTFAGLSVSGFQKESDLRDSCGQTGTCAQEDVDTVAQRYLISDIALGVGVASLGTAFALYLTRPRAEFAEAHRVGLDVATVHAGAVANLHGSF